MKTFWVSFRIKDDAGYDEAYKSLTEALQGIADATCWWFETTSFYIFNSEYSTDQVAGHIKANIRPDRDLVILGMPNFKGGRVIGNCEDQDIFRLIPDMKKV